MTVVTSEVSIEVRGADLKGFPRRGLHHFVCFCGIKRSIGCPSCGWYPPNASSRQMAQAQGLEVEELPWTRYPIVPVEPRRGTAREVVAYLKRREKESGWR